MDIATEIERMVEKRMGLKFSEHLKSKGMWPDEQERIEIMNTAIDELKDDIERVAAKGGA